MNLDTLNKQMLSRQVENEFYRSESDKPFSSLYSLVSKDISNFSAVVGVSLFGSFEKISLELSQTNLKDLDINNIRKYINYIVWNIHNLDLTNNNDSLILKFNHTSQNKHSNIITIILALYFNGLINNNQSLIEESLFILKTIIDDSFKKGLFDKEYSMTRLKEIFRSIEFMFFHEDFDDDNDSNLWEYLLFVMFESVFFDYNFNLTNKKLNKFDINEVRNYCRSTLVKNAIFEMINFRFIENKLIKSNENFIKYLRDETNHKDALNFFRKKRNYFITTIISHYWDIMNEYI
jgi:hypothetical protein